MIYVALAVNTKAGLSSNCRARKYISSLALHYTVVFKISTKFIGSTLRGPMRGSLRGSLEGFLTCEDPTGRILARIYGRIPNARKLARILELAMFQAFTVYLISFSFLFTFQCYLCPSNVALS
jgi:hypothetical protein